VLADGPGDAGVAVADDDHAVATNLTNQDAPDGNARAAVGAEQQPKAIAVCHGDAFD
jgi:hypothetical protein